MTPPLGFEGLIQLKTNKLLRCHCGWHGNHVSIAVRYVFDACHPKKASH